MRKAVLNESGFSYGWDFPKLSFVLCSCVGHPYTQFRPVLAQYISYDLPGNSVTSHLRQLWAPNTVVSLSETWHSDAMIVSDSSIPIIILMNSSTIHDHVMLILHAKCLSYFLHLFGVGWVEFCQMHILYSFAIISMAGIHCTSAIQWTLLASEENRVNDPLLSPSSDIFIENSFKYLKMSV